MRKLIPTPSGGATSSDRAGFTLIELLVVLAIVLIVSAAALPVVLPALSHRQVNESARLLQGALVGAQDAAVHANAPRGVRLLPDPTIPSTSGILGSNRMVAIEPAPDYSEGKLTARPLFSATDPSLPYPRYPLDTTNVYPFDAMGNPTVQLLLVVEQPFDALGIPTTGNVRNAPTSWFWNIRVGDKLRIGGGSHVYTVVGPLVVGPTSAALGGANPELFVNVGPPGTPSPLIQTSGLMPDGQGPREFLFLVNGQDDDGDGAIDEGWDGINNDLLNNVDDIEEWELERWLGSESVIESGQIIFNSTYTISRRPVASANARETLLPAGVVVDLTTWANASPERSRLPVDRNTGYVDVMFSPQGDVMPTTPYSTPASISMSDAFFHFWLAERQDLYEPGVSVSDPPPTLPPFLPVAPGLNPNALSALKGEFRIVTLFTRTGQITTNDTADFEPNTAAYNTATSGVPNYNPSLPFIRAQQGVRGGQ